MNYDYNTQRKDLVLPEYGRNIQMMVDYVKSIEDKKEQNDAANAILAVMGNLNPHLRDVADFKHKLWDHLAIMAEFDLDIESPYPAPDKVKLAEKPNIVPYNNSRIKYKHYGKTIERLIESAIEFEDGDLKNQLIAAIANHMKNAYLTWNRDSVTDESIFNDLRTLSDNKLKIPEGLRLQDPKEFIKTKRKKMQRKK